MPTNRLNIGNSQYEQLSNEQKVHMLSVIEFLMKHKIRDTVYLLYWNNMTEVKERLESDLFPTKS